MNWINNQAAGFYAVYRDAALKRQAELTKPPGSLGQLEGLAVWLAERQGSEVPAVDKVWISVFVGDHGVMAEQVSAFPQEVTGEMIRNFATGGAAISVLARALDARLEIMNLGVVNEPGELPGVVRVQVASQTANITQGAAMTVEQMQQAMQAGVQAAERAHAGHTQLYLCGDMGIGNTTSAAALACAYLGLEATRLVGPGTGLDKQGVAHKADVVERALKANQTMLDNPGDILQALGGFEIAAMVAAIIRSAQLGQPVLIDGYISSVAALAAVKINPSVQTWIHFSHRSAEPGHAAVLEAMQATTILDLGMRLGEASGAAVAVPLLRMACALHSQMATFAEAGVREA